MSASACVARRRVEHGAAERGPPARPRPARAACGGADRSATLIGNSAGGGGLRLSQAGCSLTRFQMPSIAFHTAEALISGSSITCTCSRARPAHRGDLVGDPHRIGRQHEQQVGAAPGRQLRGVVQRGEQRVDRVRLHRADDHRRHVAALHQRHRDLGVVVRRARARRRGRGCSVSSWRRTRLVRSITASVRSVRVLAQVQPLDRLAAGVGQRLDHRRGPHAGRVEQRDLARGGARGRRGWRRSARGWPRRRAGDDQVAQVAVDHLAAVVHLGGHALQDGRGGEAAVGLVRPWRAGADRSAGPSSPNSDFSMCVSFATTAAWIGAFAASTAYVHWRLGILARSCNRCVARRQRARPGIRPRIR